MLKIHLNAKENFVVEQDGDTVLIDGEALNWDLLQTAESSFHIVDNHQSYRVEVLEANYEEKKFTIQINGSIYKLTAQDRLDLLLKKMGIQESATKIVKDIKAPMPGLVIDITVKVGDEIKKGETLMILEAMKMENALKAPNDVVIKEIKVEQGKSVEKNQLLITFE
jgi:biotin carboxyl carrier protein